MATYEATNVIPAYILLLVFVKCLYAALSAILAYSSGIKYINIPRFCNEVTPTIPVKVAEVLKTNPIFNY